MLWRSSRSVSFDVEFRNVHGGAAAIGSAGPYTLVVDRPTGGGGEGLGFNGGQLLYLAVGGCVSNDLFREADARGIAHAGPRPSRRWVCRRTDGVRRDLLRRRDRRRCL